MSKFTDFTEMVVKKTKEGTLQIAKNVSEVAKNTQDNMNEKRVLKQAEKQRANAKNAALLALSDAANDLVAYNKNLPASEKVKTATEDIISEINKLKDIINQMTPATVVPLLIDQKERWLDEKSVTSDDENYAQQELDISEIIKRRKLAVKKCMKAIDALKEQAVKEEEE